MRFIEIVESAAALEIRHEGEMIIVSRNGRDVAWYVIERDGDTVSLHANVDAAARRQGVSTRVYDWAEEYFDRQGLRLVPAPRLSPEAFMMWKKRNPESVRSYVRDGANYYRGDHSI